VPPWTRCLQMTAGPHPLPQILLWLRQRGHTGDGDSGMLAHMGLANDRLQNVVSSCANIYICMLFTTHRALGIEKHAHHEFTSSYTHEKASRATESATVASAIQDLREVRDQHRAGHEVLKPPGMIPRQAIGATSPSSGACPRCKKGRANSKFEFTCGRRVMICKGCAQSFVLILSQKIALLQALENQKSSDTDRGEEHTHTHTHIHAAQARHEPDALPATRVQALVAHLKDVDQAFEKSPKVCDMTHPRVT